MGRFSLCLTCLLGCICSSVPPDSLHKRSLILTASAQSGRYFVGPFFTLAFQLHFPTVFKSFVLLCSVHVCMIFFCSMAEMNKLIEEKVIRVTLEETILKNGQPALTLYDTTTKHLYIQPSVFFLFRPLGTWCLNL